MTRPSGEPLNGVDVERVSAWIDDHIDGAAGPSEFSLIAGGHSNLTFKFADAAGAEFVLRRPPLGHVLASAHDSATSAVHSAMSPPPSSSRSRHRSMPLPRCRSQHWSGCHER